LTSDDQLGNSEDPLPVNRLWARRAAVARPAEAKADMITP
jgi:hypothetical protein